MAKPTVGQTGWGGVLNDHLTGMETDIAARQVAADLEADVAAKVGTAGALDTALSASYGTTQDALRPTSHRYAIPPTMIAQANSPGHSWVAAGNNLATLTLNDTTYAPIGSQSIKAVTGGNGGSGVARIDRTGMTLDLTGKSPVLWVMVEDVDDLNGLSLYLGNNGFASFYLWQFAPRLSNDFEFKSGEFVKIVLNWGDATVSGTPNRAALTSARFYAEDRNLGTGAVVHFSGLASQPEPTTRYPNGVVCFAFDDGRISQYTGARPTLDKYGYPATAYVIAERIDSDGGTAWMTTEQLQALQDRSGWEVGAHAYSTALHDQVGGFTAATEAELVEDFALLKRWLAERGLRGSDHIAYPQGAHSEAVRETVRRFYTSGRTTWGKPTASSVWPPADPYRLKTRLLQSGTESTLASIQSAVDKTVANKGSLIITGHALGATADSLTWTQADFDSLVAYVAASGAAVRTVGQMLRGE